MKKNVITLLLVLALSGAFAKTIPSDILKDEANFANVELFDDERVFFDIAQNSEVVKKYEANPTSYKDEALLPIAICYMSLQNTEKADALLQKFLQVRPDNLRAMKVRGTILLLTGKPDEALALFKKAYSQGDKEASKMIGSTYIFLRTPEKIAEVLPTLKELSSTDLPALNMVLFYAYQGEKKDLDLAREVISKIDVDKSLENASSDSVAQALNMYALNKADWKGNLLLIPAKGASLGGYWIVARQLYDQILKEDPKNIKALLGKSIIEYKLGGVPDAQELIEKAINLGEKGAVNDAMDLFLASKMKSVYEYFKPHFANFDFRTHIRISMLAFAQKYDEQADVCFLALNEGKNFQETFSDKRAKDFALKVIEKYAKDSRAEKAKSLLETIK